MDLRAPIPGTRLVFGERDVDDMLDGFRRVLESKRLILGPETERFEAACRTAVGTRHAVAVSTGTAALEVAFRAIGVEGRSVVVPTNTFYATAAAVARAGGRPVFADVGPDLMLDAASVDRAWRDDTCGVAVVHVGGMVPADLPAILGMAADRGAFVVEDAAQALGSTSPSGAAGAVGQAGAVSFYPTKIVTAGEGGVVTTDDDDLARAAVVLRDQGKASFGENVHVSDGYSWRLSELHAVVAQVHIAHLAGAVAAKRRIAAVYDECLRDSPVGVVPEPPGHRWNRYKYVAVLPDGVDRDGVRATLASRGVGLSAEVFALPLHLQPVFRSRFPSGPLPAAEDLCARHVCLPISPDLTEDEAGFVAGELLDAVAAAPVQPPGRRRPGPQ